MTGDCSVVKFLLRSANGKRLMRFHSEATAFKFLPRVWRSHRMICKFLYNQANETIHKLRTQILPLTPRKKGVKINKNKSK